MTMHLRPYRSVLYIPGSKDRALEKAQSLKLDAIIFDLEDAVSAKEKVNARGKLAAALKANQYGQSVKIVRINSLDTEWGVADAESVAGMECDAVLLPKVETTAQLDGLAAVTGDLPIWVMMETPRAMLNADAIAGHPKVAGMVMGTNDLAKDLGVRFRKDRLPLVTSLSLCVLAAKSHDVIIVDGVFNAFKDQEGLVFECNQGRDLGFDGKTLIHPAQIDVANSAFAPTDAEVDMARRQIAAFDAAEADGQGVAVVDGKIVENLHVVTAKSMIAKAEIIAALSE
ncbi:MAG: CoA ester lyase [Pseudoprimorskyibacter sp.]|nr:CoA ester lyase [Pseudoprimorskyibacter sp.]